MNNYMFTKNKELNNMNYNICNYNQNINPNNLYDFYEGFIRGNMFPDLYDGYKINKPFNIIPQSEKENLMAYINAYSFSAHDLNLYLDINPDDQNMLEAFKYFTNEANKYIKEYENKFGTICVNDSTYPWSWNNSPWPWEEE